METIRDKKNQEIADQIGKLLNGPSNCGQIGEFIAQREHRYSQEMFWTMCEGFIKQSAENKATGYFDDRNAYTVKMCSKIQKMIDDWRGEIANERRF